MRAAVARCGDCRRVADAPHVARAEAPAKPASVAAVRRLAVAAPICKSGADRRLPEPDAMIVCRSKPPAG